MNYAISNATIFSQLFYLLDYKVRDDVIQSINDIAKSRNGLEPPDGWFSEFTTNYRQKDRFLPEEVENHVKDAMRQILQSAPCAPITSDATFDLEYWFNYYDIGQEQEVHDHSSAVLSGIWYLKGSPSDTVFINPMNDYPFQPSCFTVSDEMLGSIIMFPSSCRHYVKASKSERMTVAFNATNLVYRDADTARVV